jgi:hypothetical protein
MPRARATANPNHIREKFGHLLGAKVTVGTTTLHYLCGRFVAIDGAQHQAVFSVGAREIRLPLGELEIIVAAPEHQAEYVK